MREVKSEPVVADIGSGLLYMRTNWDAAQNMRVYQDVWLPAGKYRLSADINHLSGTPDRQYTYVETGGTHLSLWPSATGTWETVTQEFELEEDGEITLSFGFSTPGGNNAVKLLADHVKLELVPPTYITNYVAAMQEALKWQEQLDATAFPSVAERLSAAIGTEVGNGEEAAYLAATALLQEAAAYGRSACAINQENGDATGILANPEANEGTTGWETSLTSIQNRESYKGTTDNYFEGGNQDETAWEASMHCHGCHRRKCASLRHTGKRGGASQRREGLRMEHQAHRIPHRRGCRMHALRHCPG